MIRSMTGFGRAEGELDGRTFTVEVRTVNHRFLDISARLPRGYQSIEGKLRAHIAKRMTRGKVSLTATRQETQGLSSWNQPLADRFHAHLLEVRERYGFREPIGLGHLLSHPELFRDEEDSADIDAAWPAAQPVFDRALDELIAMREKEGKAMADDLAARVVAMREVLSRVEARAPQRVEDAKERLRQRVAEILNGEAEVDNDRLLVEAAFQAERMDCTEECVRLVSHFDQFDGMISDDSSVGRKLNFLMQEMNREVNTIGSKASDADIAKDVILLKEEIEIIREQVQNIE